MTAAEAGIVGHVIIKRHLVEEAASQIEMSAINAKVRDFPIATALLNDLAKRLRTAMGDA